MQAKSSSTLFLLVSEVYNAKASLRIGGHSNIGSYSGPTVSSKITGPHLIIPSRSKAPRQLHWCKLLGESSFLLRAVNQPSAAGYTMFDDVGFMKFGSACDTLDPLSYNPILHTVL